MTYSYTPLDYGTLANDGTGDPIRTLGIVMDSSLEQLMVTSLLVSSCTANYILSSPASSPGIPLPELLGVEHLENIVSAGTTGITDLSVVTYNRSGLIIGTTERSLSSIDLSPSGVVAGTYGSTTEIPLVTVDATGVISHCSSTSITLLDSGIAAGTYSKNKLDINASGMIVAASPAVISLSNSSVVSGTYGSASTLPVVTVLASGVVNGVTNVAFASAAAPSGYVDNVIFTYTSTTEITLEAGWKAMDSTGTVLMSSTTAIIATTVPAIHTWYYPYAIATTAGVVSFMISTTDEDVSGTIALPSGYTYKRQLVGAFRTKNALAEFKSFKHSGGDYFMVSSSEPIYANNPANNVDVAVSCVSFFPPTCEMVHLTLGTITTLSDIISLKSFDGSYYKYYTASSKLYNYPIKIRPTASQSITIYEAGTGLNNMFIDLIGFYSKRI